MDVRPRRWAAGTSRIRGSSSSNDPLRRRQRRRGDSRLRGARPQGDLRRGRRSRARRGARRRLHGRLARGRRRLHHGGRGRRPVRLTLVRPPADATGVVIASPWSWLHDIPAIAERWLPLMFFLCMLAIVYLLWRTLSVMPRVKPTHVEPGSRESVSLDDVAGVTEAKAELQEVIDFLKDPKRFEQLGAKVPKGILLYGPPGTGKTLLAKGVAGESGARFFSQIASAFVEMFVGLGAARMRKLFDEARKRAPSIIFIDELDAVGAARTGQGFTREQDQTLNQLLVELDGFSPSDQVVVMAASNRLQDLDPALLRPGRFDRQIPVGPPELDGREASLHVHTRNKPLAADVDLGVVARQTSGLTGADLANIANEAAIFAGRRNV